MKTSNKLAFRFTKVCVLILILLMPFTGMSQTEIVFPKVSEMSPNAASIAQYQDCPISYYTGTPEINIPIYEIDVDGFKLPISLSYHASGIRVSQEASWVGLGWALNVGGTISRTINNFDDFLNGPDCNLDDNSALNSNGIDDEHQYAHKGFYFAPKYGYRLGKDGKNYPNTYKTLFISDSSNKCFLSQIFHVYDNEPDIFNYSLPSFSGKFTFDNDKNVILQNKDHNLIFEPTYNKTWGCVFFTVKDGYGNKYIFRDVEKSQNYHQKKALNKNGTVNPTKHDNTTSDFISWSYSPLLGDWDAYYQNPYKYVSSWYLSEIVTNNNRHIFFTYEKEDQFLPTQESCERMVIDSKEDAGVDYYQSKTVNEALRLKRIDCDFCHVEFSASDRFDIKSSKVHPSKKLDCISIYNCNNISIKKITFDYDYFNSEKIGDDYDYVFTRLKLKSVLDNNIGQPYTFSYDENNSMPAKNSKNTDYWGYYNGRNYGAEYNIAAKINGYCFNGVNKATNPKFASTYVLNKIQYPTGGYESYEYESHYIGPHFENLVSGDPGPTGPIRSDYSTHVLTYNDAGIHEFENCPSDTTIAFTVKTSASLYVTCTLESANGAKKDPSFDYNDYLGTITKKSNNQKKHFSNEFPSEFEGYLHKERRFDLEPGDYEFYTGKLPEEVYAEWTFDDKYEGARICFNTDNSQPNNTNSVKDVYGGGLRIKTIQSDIKRRTFSYTLGKVLTEPIFTSWRNYTKEKIANILHSESITSMSTFNNGNTVGYDCVTETIDDADNPSYTKYHYKNEGEYELQDDNFPTGPININYTDGLLEKIEVFWDDVLVKEKIYNYASTYSNRIEALFDRSEQYLSLPNASYTTYYYTVEWPKLSQEIEILYDVNDTSKKTTVTKSYAYNDYDLISEEDTYNGMTCYKNIIKYPFNFVHQNDIYNEMMLSNVISTPVEIIRLKDNAVIGGTRANYQKFNNMFLIKSHEELDLTVPTNMSDYYKYYSCKETFDYLDNYGKLKEYTNSSGKLLTYLWGYNYQYPIAIIENIKYEDAESALGTEEYINSFLSRSNYDILDIWYFMDKLAPGGKMNAHTKMFTYKPLVGITSETAPNGYTIYYKYDSSGRLVRKEDAVRKTIQTFEYNYHQE